MVFLTTLFNAIPRVHHYLQLWKVSQIIVVRNAGKNPDQISSYRPISLLPAISKLFERILAERIRPILEISEHQFDFRQAHSTTHQEIQKALEERKFYSAVFLDIEAAFDRVWHDGLLFKIKRCLPGRIYLLLKSYLESRSIFVEHQGESSTIWKIHASVPQGSVLGPMPYCLYTMDIQVAEETTIATFADDAAALGISKDSDQASSIVLEHITKIQDWFHKWRIKANPNKGVHVTFTMRNNSCPPIVFNGEMLPEKDEVKYLGFHVDRRLTWKRRITAKRNELNRRYRRMNLLVGRKSALNPRNKLLTYC